MHIYITSFFQLVPNLTAHFESKTITIFSNYKSIPACILRLGAIHAIFRDQKGKIESWRPWEHRKTSSLTKRIYGDLSIRDAHTVT